MSPTEDAVPSRAALLGSPVIDARAPRFNRAIIWGAALTAFLLGWWPLLSLAALQLALTPLRPAVRYQSRRRRDLGQQTG